MEVKNIMSIMVVALVGAVILTGFLPVLGATQEGIGTPISFTNSPSITNDNELLVTNDISTPHTFSAEYPNAYVTIDGEQIPTANAVQGFYFVSDGVSVCNTGAFFVVSYGETVAQYSPSWNVALSVTFENGVSTFTYRDGGTTNTYTTNYTWIGYRVTEGGNYVNKVNVAVATYHDMSDFIAMGNYTTGENDTYYLAKDGVISLSESQYNASLTTINTTDVSGTTDVYRGTLRVNVDDESFTPFVWAVKKTIDGHEDSGALYDVYGLIPLMVAIGLLMFAITAILIRRV